jgi:hypothetical protein
MKTIAFGTRLGGIFGLFGFLGIGTTAYSHQGSPLFCMGIGLVAGLVLFFVGRSIGYILMHPQGNTQKLSESIKDAKASGHKKSNIGDQAFLDDIGH